MPTELTLRATKGSALTHDEVDANFSALKVTADAAAEATGYTGNTLVSGGGVAWDAGLTFIVSAASYIIAGTAYESAQTSVTLSAADGSNPRIDLIVVNTSGVVAVVEGTAAASPAAPDIDPATQLQLTFVYVATSATTPSNVAATDLYHEDAGEPTEWTASKSGTPIVVASTNNPRAGTKCIEATSATTGNYFMVADAAAFDTASRNYLVFYIRSKATWPTSRSLTIRWYSGTSTRGSAVSFINGSFGFDSSNTTDYQQIVIPLWLFGVAALSVDRVRFTVGGSGATIGFYVDDIELQGGVSDTGTSTAEPVMIWRGDWNATVSYVTNDVVSNGATYVCLVPNTNTTPVDGATWKFLAAGAGGGGDGAGIVRIGQVVTAGSAATITFSSITGIYSALKIVLCGRFSGSDGAAAHWILFNGDTTAANYGNAQFMQGSNTGLDAGIQAGATTGMRIGVLCGVAFNAQAIGIVEVIIPMYAQTTFHKAIMSQSYIWGGNDGNSIVVTQGGRWASTAAITSITMTCGSGNYVNGTTATLYGVP